MIHVRFKEIIYFPGLFVKNLRCVFQENLFPQNNCIIVNFSQLCGRLVVFVLFRGEIWSAKLIETRVSINKEHGPKKDQSKQKIEMNSAIGLCPILLIFHIGCVGRCMYVSSAE